MTWSEILVVIDSKLLGIETRKRLGHPLERVIIKHRCKTVGPKILIKNLLSLVATGRYGYVLSESPRTWMTHWYVNSLGLAIHLRPLVTLAIHLLSLVHLIYLLHPLIKRRPFSKELVHEVSSKARVGVPWSHFILRGLLRNLLLGYLLRLRLYFLLFLAKWSTLGVGSCWCVVDVHAI